MASKQEFAAVIDVGSTKITALAGLKTDEGKLEILGQASVPSRGIRRGIIQNPEEFSGAVRQLVLQLEEQSGCKIRLADVALAGQGVSTEIFEGVRHIETGIVSQADVDYLEGEAAAMPLDPGYRIYHLFPRGFEVDDDTDVSVPAGHVGRKLKARYTLVTAPASYQESVEKAFSHIGLQLGKLVISPLAVADAVVNEDEKEIGVVVVDIGGGTTKMVTYSGGSLTHVSVIPFAGEVITHDIQEGCSIIWKWAEQLKIQYGSAMGDFADEKKVVTIPGHNGWEPKEISFKTLAYIIQARLEEIIDCVYLQIGRSGILDRAPQGIVLTGGATKMVNLLQLVKFRTAMDAKLGFSQVRFSSQTELDKTCYLTALGLLRYSLKTASPGSRHNLKEGRKGMNPSGFFSSLGKIFSQQIDIMFQDEDKKL